MENKKIIIIIIIKYKINTGSSNYEIQLRARKRIDAQVNIYRDDFSSGRRRRKSTIKNTTTITIIICNGTT